MKIAIVAALLLVALGVYTLTPSVKFTTGRVVTSIPVQEPTSAKPFVKNGYTLIPVAEFSVSARLLSKSIYRFDRQSELAPVDYALGWLSMSMPNIIKEFDISQSGRFYTWYTDDFPLPRDAVETQSANMHLIPATDEIEAQLRALPEGSLVRLTGLLVDIEAPDGFTWPTSRTRADTGAGACEVIYVKSVVKGE